MIGNKSWECEFFCRTKAKEVMPVNYLQFVKNQHLSLFAASKLFLKLIQYNTRAGLKLRTLNTHLRLVQIFFKIFKLMTQKRRRRLQQFINFKEFEFMFQRMLNIKQLLLTKKLVRKRGRHKNFDYKFIPLYKNKRINQLMYWLRLLSFKYSSRKYVTRLIYVYYDFLFLSRYSYTVRLHKSLRMEYFLKKKKKFKEKRYIKRRMYLGKLSRL